MSHTAYWLDDGTPVPHTFSNVGGALTFDNIPIVAAGRQFELAEEYFLKAIDLAPEQGEPITGLGRLYLQTGEEAKALETLKKAHTIDDFRADVEELLEHGADVNAPDGRKATPMHHAAADCHATTARVLLEAGADINRVDELLPWSIEPNPLGGIEQAA